LLFSLSSLKEATTFPDQCPLITRILGINAAEILMIRSRGVFPLNAPAKYCKVRYDKALLLLLRCKLSHRVCPWWLGYFLASPLRRLIQDPEEIVSPYVKEGMRALDIGCGMGFFSLPLARLVGPAGRIVCIDLQEKMIKGLHRRALKAGLSNRIDARICRQDSLNIADVAGKIDFALAFALVHEVPDKERLFSEIYKAMKQNGNLLLAEPKGHVSGRDFEKTVAIAQDAGFKFLHDLKIQRSRAVLLVPQPG
jgi:2-polyprenyl-3-methyl-5-hydroxy-6-metoxy-1,4-benzoquinol methylase